MNWTREAVLALAPDASSASAAQGLTSSAKWPSLGRSERAIWGECQGSGSSPYRAAVDLEGPAFRCSCPSRKFPCKHALALLLLWAGKPDALRESPLPDWVGEWLSRRETRQTQEPKRTESPRPEEHAKRAADREARILAGLQELDLWLRDLVRQGLAAAQSRPARFWEGMAARMVDAQAPGIARMLRDMAGVPGSGEGWPERLLVRTGRLYLLIEGYRRAESLPEDLRAAVRGYAGWTQKQEEVLAGEGVSDSWVVLGRREYEEDRLTVQRTWLRGRSSERWALSLSFAAPGQTLDRSLVPGCCFEGDLAYYTGSWPLRALIKDRKGIQANSTAMSGMPTLEVLLDSYAAALARDPWIEPFPALLDELTPAFNGGRWLIVDSAGAAAPLSAPGQTGWKLRAMSGGRPIHIFGEWDGGRLTPLSAWSDGRFVPLTERA